MSRLRQCRAGDDGQLGETAKHESVTVAPVEFVGGDAEAEAREATQQGPDCELAFDASERRTEAVMDSVSEREVAALGSIEDQLVRLGVLSAVAVGRC